MKSDSIKEIAAALAKAQLTFKIMNEREVLNLHNAIHEEEKILKKGVE